MDIVNGRVTIWGISCGDIGYGRITIWGISCGDIGRTKVHTNKPSKYQYLQSYTHFPQSIFNNFL